MTDDLRTPTRRQAMQTAAGVAGAATVPGAAFGKEPVATKRRLKQSLCQWCYSKYWKIEEMCQIAKQLGCFSIELGEPKDFPLLKQNGLVCALAMSHWFDKGM